MKDISNTQVTKADGIFGTMKVIYGMDVPTSGSSAASTIPAGQSMQGNNARNYQLLSLHDNGFEFFGIGYVAGTSTGLNSSRAVLKQAYNDGTTCSDASTSNCNYQLFINKNVQGDQVLTFQIQRQATDANGHHAYRFWLDNVLVNARETSMVSGVTGLGSERQHVQQNTQTVKMDGDFSDLNYHYYGNAESSPPGHTNYTRPYNLLITNQASGCSLAGTKNSSNQLYSITVTGRC